MSKRTQDLPADSGQGFPAVMENPPLTDGQPAKHKPHPRRAELKAMYEIDKIMAPLDEKTTALVIAWFIGSYMPGGSQATFTAPLRSPEAMQPGERG